jgi:hypothetical protein
MQVIQILFRVIIIRCPHPGPCSWQQSQGHFNDVSWLRFVWSSSQKRQHVERPPEHLDVQAILSRGIRIGYTPEVLTDAGALFLSSDTILVDYVASVADICVMLALMAGRNVRETMQIVDSGRVRK